MPDSRRKSSSRKRLTVLISGNGSNLQAIIDSVNAQAIHAEIVRVVSNRDDAGGLAKAQIANIPVSIARTDDALRAALTDAAPDIIALAGFMRILNREAVRQFEGRILNIHPSLLPEYKGLHTHSRVLKDRRRYHGCSVHFVTEELDSGPVILQARVPVSRDDSPATLASRVLRYEHLIYPQALRWYCEDRLRLENGQCLLDGKILDLPRTWGDDSA